MKSIAAILLAGSAMIGVAQAQTPNAMEAYSDCWAAVSVAHLTEVGTTEKTMAQAVGKADMVCAPQKKAAASSEGAEVAQEMRDYMEIALHRANPVE